MVTLWYFRFNFLVKESEPATHSHNYSYHMMPVIEILGRDLGDSSIPDSLKLYSSVSFFTGSFETFAVSCLLSTLGFYSTNDNFEHFMIDGIIDSCQFFRMVNVKKWGILKSVGFK